VRPTDEWSVCKDLDRLLQATTPPQLSTESEDSVITTKELPLNVVPTAAAIQLRPNNLYANSKKLQFTASYSVAGSISCSQEGTSSD
jgi:hypothetical protein